MLQNIPKEKILEVVRQGPTIPSKIVKVVGGDTMLIGAMLSTMISTGEVKYSSLKVGGSPVYYIPGQEEKLEDFIQYLNDKDQKTATILKDQRILQDSMQDPMMRVSLKAIKDFAKPFEMAVSEKKELFYRYFIVPISEAELLARNVIKDTEKTSQEIMVDTSSSSLDKMAEIHRAMSEESKDIQKDASLSTPLTDSSEKPIIEHKKKKSEENIKSDFFESIKIRIHNLGLDIVGKEKIKKTEYSLILKNHDSNEYIYCVAKDKKTINEGDLSTAFVFAHQKKMPCIFLMTGKLSKKAQAMSQKEFINMKIEQL